MPHEGRSYDVVRAVPGDGAALHALAAATFHDACPPGTDRAVSDAHVAGELSAERFEGWLADERHHLLFLTDRADGTRAGYVLLVQDDPVRGTPLPGEEGELPEGSTWFVSKFYVLSDHRGTGASARLMEAAKSLAAGDGATGLWLTVNQLNTRANAFYERHGLHVVGTATFSMGGQLHDDFVRLARL